MNLSGTAWKKNRFAQNRTEATDDTEAAASTHPMVGEHNHDYVLTEYVSHTCTQCGHAYTELIDLPY